MPSGEMNDVYTVGVNNRFLGIDNDIIDDPLELIRAAQEKPKKEKEVKPKGRKDVKPVKAAKEKTVKIESPTENENPESKKSDRPRSDRPRGRGRGGRGRGERGGRGRGGRGGFNAGSPSGDQSIGFDNNNSGGFKGGYSDNNGPSGGGFRRRDQVSSDNQNEGFGSSGGFGSGGGFGDNDEEKRGGRSGYRGGRGGRGGRGRGGRGGHREFDRRSGSDKSSVKAFDKREGSGSFNWGTPQDELAASEEQQSGGFGAPKATAEDTPAEPTEQTPETEETTPDEKPEEGPQEITYEEWKKQQDEGRSKPQFNLRKVDGVEKKGMKQIKKPTEEENEADGSLFFPKKYYEEKYKTSGRVKEHMNLDFQFTSGDNRHLDLDRNRRGRNRGGRGGRSGKKDESGSSRNAELALENTEEFPSLG